MPPTSVEQIRFMVNIQRLLDEGLFTASYKFALLHALAVLSIEQRDDSGAPLELTTDAIAEKTHELCETCPSWLGAPAGLEKPAPRI
jgi:hypothetical protein